MRAEKHPADRLLEGRDAMVKTIGEIEELLSAMRRGVEQLGTLAARVRPLPADLVETVLLDVRRTVEKLARENDGGPFNEIFVRLALILTPDAGGSGRDVQ